MKRVLETDDIGELEVMKAYDSLKSLDLVNGYFLLRAFGLCPRGRIFDVGCGTGKMLRMIDGDYEKHGVDISPSLIDFAKSKDKSSRYEVVDSNQLPYENNYFDLVMSHSLLHHLQDPRQTISEIERVAKPSGAILVRDLCRPDTKEDLQRLYLGYLASGYDKVNRRLFENSLRSSFDYDEWASLFKGDIRPNNLLFYNVAERPAKGVELDEDQRKFDEMEFIVDRLTLPIASK